MLETKEKAHTILSTRLHSWRFLGLQSFKPLRVSKEGESTGHQSHVYLILLMRAKEVSACSHAHGGSLRPTIMEKSHRIFKHNYKSLEVEGDTEYCTATAVHASGVRVSQPFNP